MNDDEVPDGYVPLAPLEAIARAGYEKGEDNKDEWSDRKFAALIGVSNRAVGRWRAAGGIVPWQSADLAAVALGLHPLSVWPERWLALDRGLLAGTDRRALREYDEAMEQIGRVLDARSKAAV